MKHYQYVFVAATYLTYVLYFVTYVGVWKNAPEYLDQLQYFFKIFISLVLILLFHPFSKTTFTPFHKQVVFTAAVYLLTTTTFSIFLRRASEIKSRVVSDLPSLGSGSKTLPTGPVSKGPV